MVNQMKYVVIALKITRMASMLVWIIAGLGLGFAYFAVVDILISKYLFDVFILTSSVSLFVTFMTSPLSFALPWIVDWVGFHPNASDLVFKGYVVWWATLIINCLIKFAVDKLDKLGELDELDD